jgi:hypothetical protein
MHDGTHVRGGERFCGSFGSSAVNITLKRKNCLLFIDKLNAVHH